MFHDVTYTDLSRTCQKAQVHPVPTHKGSKVDVDVEFTMYSPSAYYNNAIVWYTYNGTPVRLLACSFGGHPLTVLFCFCC